MVDWAPTGTGGSKGGGPGRQSMHLDANFMHRGGILRDPAPFLLPRQRPGETRLPDTWPRAHSAPRTRPGAHEEARANKGARTRRPGGRANKGRSPSRPPAPAPRICGWDGGISPGPRRDPPRRRLGLGGDIASGRHSSLPRARRHARPAATAARTSANKREQEQPGSRRDRPRPAPKCFWRPALGICGWGHAFGNATAGQHKPPEGIRPRDGDLPRPPTT